MSQGNVEVVREVFSAFMRGDPDGVVRHLSRDVDWKPSAYLTGQARYSGTDGVRQWMNQVADLPAFGVSVLTEPVDFRDLGDTVIVLGRGKVLRDEGTFVQELGWVWRFEGGKVVAMTNFPSHDQALRAAGVSE
jgi:ketosteroid isomerase-like protein